jgi:hypothetical protein
MRCRKVIRELAAPTGHLNSAAIDEHLARCPACRAWSERAKELDRLWHATRPPEPTTQTWDTVWANLAGVLDGPVAKGLESPPLFGSNDGLTTPINHTRVLKRSPGSHWRTLAGISLVGLAQAAAVLLAVGLTRNGSDPSRPPQTAMGTESPGSSAVSRPDNLPVNPSSAVPSTIEIEEGQLVVVLIRNQGKSSSVVERTPEVPFLEVDNTYLLHSAMESEAQPKVAMKD